MFLCCTTIESDKNGAYLKAGKRSVNFCGEFKTIKPPPQFVIVASFTGCFNKKYSLCTQFEDRVSGWLVAKQTKPVRGVIFRF